MYACCGARLTLVRDGQKAKLPRVQFSSLVLPTPHPETLDGLAIHNANRGDWRESIREKKKKKLYFHRVRAIRANRLKKPAIRNF